MPTKYNPEYYLAHRDEIKARALRYYHARRQKMIEAGIIVPKPAKIGGPGGESPIISPPVTPESTKKKERNMPRVGQSITLHFD